MGRPAAVGELEEERNIKGYRFQDKIRERLESITSNYWWCENLIEPRVQGQSNIWTTDLVVATEHVITGDHLYLAIIECKGPRRGVSSPVYWTHMSRAYMELNDLQLRRAKGCRSFYLIVNRRPEKGESPKLDYPKLFKNIEVDLVHDDDPEEQASFEEQIRRLCRESSPVRQLEAMGPDELEKFSLEVQKKAVERAEKRVDELERALDYIRKLKREEPNHVEEDEKEREEAGGRRRRVGRLQGSPRRAGEQRIHLEPSVHKHAEPSDPGDKPYGRLRDHQGPEYPGGSRRIRPLPGGRAQGARGCGEPGDMLGHTDRQRQAPPSSRSDGRGPRLGDTSTRRRVKEPLYPEAGQGTPIWARRRPWYSSELWTQ